MQLHLSERLQEPEFVKSCVVDLLDIYFFSG